MKATFNKDYWGGVNFKTANTSVTPEAVNHGPSNDWRLRKLHPMLPCLQQLKRQVACKPALQLTLGSLHVGRSWHAYFRCLLLTPDAEYEELPSRLGLIRAKSVLDLRA